MLREVTRRGPGLGGRWTSSPTVPRGVTPPETKGREAGHPQDSGVEIGPAGIGGVIGADCGCGGTSGITEEGKPSGKTAGINTTGAGTVC